MKSGLIILSLFCLGSFQWLNTIGTQNFDRKEFYKILKSGTVGEIDSEIALVKTSGMADKDAFEGTLLMKKAGLIEKPKDKLNFFKSGRIKLETAIRDDSINAEFRFMRLIIQEHAPKQAKYRGQLKTDADFITKNFKNISPEVQHIVIDYCKSSKTLREKDLQP